MPILKNLFCEDQQINHKFDRIKCESFETFNEYIIAIENKRRVGVLSNLLHVIQFRNFFCQIWSNERV